MEWINYHHLLYFWVVAREGGLTPAGKVLRLSHPTLSAQVHQLEDALGQPLFNRVGRRLVLTEMGDVVFRYADEIFSLGQEMVDTVRGRSTGHPLQLKVGVSGTVPKQVVRRLLQPALNLGTPVRISCQEDADEQMLADLALHRLHLMISDAPAPALSNIHVFSHLLGESGITIFAVRRLARAHQKDFPRSLDKAPILLPLEGHGLRRSLNQWFDLHNLRPRVVADFADSALLKTFGADGAGLFPAPTVVEQGVIAQYGVVVVGRIPEVREQFYAISAERRIKNPAAAAVLAAARGDFFGK